MIGENSNQLPIHEILHEYWIIALQHIKQQVWILNVKEISNHNMGFLPDSKLPLIHDLADCLIGNISAHHQTLQICIDLFLIVQVGLLGNFE